MVLTNNVEVNMAFRLELDVAQDNFPADFDVKNGQDVTEVLRQKSPFIIGPFFPKGTPPVKATVVNAIGPGGGNPLVHIDFNNPDDARKWFYEVYEDGSGLSDEEIEEEFEMAAYLN